VRTTLEVSDKLNEVRGAIEERQAEFEALSKQVETVAITSLCELKPPPKFRPHWRPLYQLKIAAREGLEGFGEYAASMDDVCVLSCPRSCCGCSRSSPGAVGWRILKWAARRLFIPPNPA